MRGFPLLNLIGILALLGLMAVPLAAISGKQAAPQAAGLVSQSAKTAVRSTVVTLVLVHPVTSASMWKDGRMIFEWKAPQQLGTRLEATVDLPYFEGTAEFELRLQWPEGTPKSVAEVTLAPEGLDAKTQNVWGDGRAEEIVTLGWEVAP